MSQNIFIPMKNLLCGGHLKSIVCGKFVDKIHIFEEKKMYLKLIHMKRKYFKVGIFSGINIPFYDTSGFLS